MSSFDVELSLPGSKSISNRVLMMAALADQNSVLENLADCDDVETCRKALQAMRSSRSIDCRDSGIVTRFLLPVCAALSGEYYFDGSARMRERPIGALLQVLQTQGVAFQFLKEKQRDFCNAKMILTSGSRAKFCEAKFPRDDSEKLEGMRMPLILKSQGLRGGEVLIDVCDSSQFLSGLLIAAPLAQEGMILKSTQRIAQQPYVLMTLKLMSQFGITFEMLDDFTVRVPSQKYQAASIWVEPDASTASYFFAAVALLQGSVTVLGLKLNSLQGDVRFLEVLKTLGCEVSETSKGVRVVGPKQLSALGEIDMSGFSDTFMTLAVMAPFLPSPTKILGLHHARLQESDRVAAMAEGLMRVGVRCEVADDALMIYPGEVHGALIDSYQDHRIAMAFAVLGLKVPGIEISGSSCVSKTCPGFFKLLAQLRGGYGE